MTAYAVKTEFVYLVDWWIPGTGSGQCTVTAPSQEDAKLFVTTTFDCQILGIRKVENFVLLALPE